MPLESLSCTQCGSGDIQEVKTDTYFCNHCERVFKYVDAASISAATGCELTLDGKKCGVQAAGRCLECGRAMCFSHWVRDEPRSECTECQHHRLQRLSDIFHGVIEDDDPRVRQSRDAQEQIKRIAYQLTQAGYLPDSQASGGGRSNRGWLRRVAGDHEHGNVSHNAWYVGEYGWEIPENEPRSDRAKTWTIARTFVTIEGRLMMEGGHVYGENADFYIPFKPAPFKNCSDSSLGEGELWKEVVSKMVAIARQHGLRP